MKRFLAWFYSDAGGGRALFYANTCVAGALLAMAVIDKDAFSLLLAVINGFCAFSLRASA